MIQPTQSYFIGTWRISEMEAWDADYFDREAPAFIVIREYLTGEFQFGLVQGDLDGRVETVAGEPRFDFSWTGFDESDPVSGRGWLRVDGKKAEGQLFIHRGDESGFKAVRQ